MRKLVMYLGQSSDSSYTGNGGIEFKHTNRTIFGVNLATKLRSWNTFFLKRLYNLELLATRGSII